MLPVITGTRYRTSLQKPYYTNVSDVPRSLQSWVSTIHTVVLTADVFQLVIKKYLQNGCSYAQVFLKKKKKHWRKIPSIFFSNRKQWYFNVLKGRIITGLFRQQMSTAVGVLLVIWYSDLLKKNKKMKKKQAKNWTRNVIYVSIFQGFHLNRIWCRNRGVQTIPFFCTQVTWFFFFNWNNISRGILSWFC